MFSKFFFKIKIDPYITGLTFLLLFFGFIMFFSAALGVMVRYEAKFFAILQNQFLFGLLLGSVAFFTATLMPKNFIRNISPIIYIVGIILCILVFVPGIGVEHGGARRWIELFGFSMQPSEVLKYASVLLLGAFYYFFYNLPDNIYFRFLPLGILAIGTSIVLIEPDLGTSTIIFSGIFSIFFIHKAKPLDIFLLGALFVLVFGLFYTFYPHAKERVNTFLFPDKNTEHQNFQVKQTRISIGSGELFGEGYGRGIQKFHHLPEPVGDSIYAVIGEEFGFIGSIFFLLIVLVLGLRLLFVSKVVRDPFEKSVLIGTGSIIMTQAFLNAGSATGAIPFTGVPFPLVSHGSTSIIITMAMLGLCAQISARRFIH